MELLVFRKYVDPDENARRVEVHENLRFHSQFGSTFVPLSSPATADGLLELRGCSSTYIPTSDNYGEKYAPILQIGSDSWLVTGVEFCHRNFDTLTHDVVAVDFYLLKYLEI